MINPTQLKCLGLFSIFAVIGFGPISPGCLIGMSIVIFRPDWFWSVTQGLYAKHPVLQQAIHSEDSNLQTKETRKKCFLSLLGLFIIDIAPVPVTPVIAFVMILSRPAWFYRMVAVIYGLGFKGK